MQDVILNNPVKKGRKTKDDDIKNATEIFNYILTQSVNQKRSIDREELQREFGLSETRARSIQNYLSLMFSRINTDSNGFVLVDDTSSYYWSQTIRNMELKERVAEEVAKRIPQRSSVACGSGTTVAQAIARVLEARSFVNVMTNSCGVMEHLTALGQTKMEFAGGLYDQTIHACLGTQVVKAFAHAHFSQALIGVSGVDRDGNLFVAQSQEEEILRQILKSTTDQIYILATVDKLARNDMWPFANINELAKTKNGPTVNLITNPIELFPRSGQVEKARETMDTLKDFIIFTKKK